VQRIGQQFLLATKQIEFLHNLRSRRVVHIMRLLLVELYCLRDKHVLILFRLSRSCFRIMRRRLIPSYCTFKRGQRHTENLQSLRTALCPFDSRGCCIEATTRERTIGVSKAKKYLLVLLEGHNKATHAMACTDRSSYIKETI
jgi:hypothetical protein